MYKFGKYAHIIIDFLLSLIFTQESFSIEKIYTIHRDTHQEIRGQQLKKDNFLYILPYHGYVRDLLWSIKFRNNKKGAEILGEVLSNILLEHMIEWEQFSNFTNPIIATVPSSRRTVLSRGFDQNNLIIKSFIRSGGNNFCTYLPNAIKKIRNIPKQSRTRSKQERLKNPKGAFKITKPELIKNRNIILFDDILTTGATTQEIKKLLHQAGASQVKIVVIAH